MAKAKYKEKKEEDPKRPQPVARDGAYVMMLFITLVAIATGCVLMYLDNEEYGGKSPPKEAAPAIQKLGDPFKDKDTGAAGGARPGAWPAPPGGWSPRDPWPAPDGHDALGIALIPARKPFRGPGFSGAAGCFGTNSPDLAATSYFFFSALSLMSRPSGSCRKVTQEGAVGVCVGQRRGSSCSAFWFSEPRLPRTRRTGSGSRSHPVWPEHQRQAVIKNGGLKHHTVRPRWPSRNLAG